MRVVLSRILVLFAAVSWTTSACAMDEARRIAVAVIQERAGELTASGHETLANHLVALARGVNAGQVALADAACVVQMACAGVATRIPVSLTDAIPALTPQQMNAALDGTPLHNETNPPIAIGSHANVDNKQRAMAVTTVLATSRGADGKTALVMIGAGSDKNIAVGNRYEIRHLQSRVAVVAVSQAKETMAVCVVIPGIDGTNADDIHEGDEVLVAP